MKNKEPSARSALMVSVISGVMGFINGVWVVLAGTSYFHRLSPYAVIFRAIYGVAPLQFIEDLHDFLFRSGFQFILAPLLGALFGVVIGYIASRLNVKYSKLLLMINGAISSGIGGFLVWASSI